jgi:hypothetical protein
MKEIESPVPLERIQQAILLIRGQRVMLDADLVEWLHPLPGKRKSAFSCVKSGPRVVEDEEK